MKLTGLGNGGKGPRHGDRPVQAHHGSCWCARRGGGHELRRGKKAHVVGRHVFAPLRRTSARVGRWRGGGREHGRAPPLCKRRRDGRQPAGQARPGTFGGRGRGGKRSESRGKQSALCVYRAGCSGAGESRQCACECERGRRGKGAKRREQQKGGVCVCVWCRRRKSVCHVPSEKRKSP